MHLQESDVKPVPTQDFVVRDLKFGMNRQQTTIESARDLESTQESLNTWDGVHLNSIQRMLMTILAQRYHQHAK